MSLNKFSSWNMDNIIIVAGTFYEKHTNRHILYNRQNSRQRERERARGRGNVWQRWKHTPQIIIFLSLSFGSVYSKRSTFVHVLKEPLEIIYFDGTHTQKKIVPIILYFTSIFYSYYTSGVNDEPLDNALASHWCWCWWYVYIFETLNSKDTINRREWWVDIHIHVHTLTAGISVVYYECAGRWWNRHQIFSGAENVGKNLNTSHCNLYQPKSY